MTPPTTGSSGARALALLLIGLFLGAMVTLVAMQSLRQKSGYADGLMAVLQHHHNQIRQQVRRGSCNPPELERSWSRLQALAQDIPQALPAHGSLVQEMTDDLVAALRLPEGSDACSVMAQVSNATEQACKACHTQLR